MKSLNKIAELADIFEHKVAQNAPIVNQSGTTELFFDNINKQQAFATAIQNPSGAVYKILSAAWEKTGGKSVVSFDLKATTTPKVGAQWVLTVYPPTLKAAITFALDGIYQQIVGGTMSAKQKMADAKAKTGSGSGTLNIGALELAP